MLMRLKGSAVELQAADDGPSFARDTEMFVVQGQVDSSGVSRGQPESVFGLPLDLSVWPEHILLRLQVVDRDLHPC